MNMAGGITALWYDNYIYESEEEAGLIGDEYEFASGATPANLENLPIEKMGRY